MTKATVWITGATGFTGTFLSEYLRNLDVELNVVGLARSKTASVKTNRFYSADLTKSDIIEKIVAKEPPSLVFHLAGLTPPTDELKMWHVNVGGTVRLLRGLVSAGCTDCKVISAGSAAEYRMAAGGQMSENSPCGGETPYGITKWAQTNVALSIGKELGIHVAIARPFNLIGPNLPERLVAGALCSQFANPDHKDIVVGNVKSERDFIDIRDAVDAYWKISQTSEAGEIYNICSGKPTRIEKLLSIFLDLSTSEKKIITDSSRMRKIDLDRVYGTNNKLRRITGWKPRLSLEQSLRDMLEAAAK